MREFLLGVIATKKGPARICSERPLSGNASVPKGLTWG